MTALLPPVAVAPAEAARLIGLSRTEFYRRMSAGEIPARKVGRRTLIEYTVLTDYITRLPVAEFRATN